MGKEFDFGDRLDPPFGDDDIMPFGKHKGKKMRHVPGSYLLWFMEQEWAEKSFPQVLAYAQNNIEEIEESAKDEKKKPDINYDEMADRHIEELDTPW